jgi:adenine-specific DNA-methyltransferase
VPPAQPLAAASAALSPVQHADLARLDASRLASRDDRAAIGQFLTPAPTARFMASLLRLDGDRLRVLDPGAGVGALTAALVERFCEAGRGRHMDLVAYENDDVALPLLRDTLAVCVEACEDAGATATSEVRAEDFLRVMPEGNLFGGDADAYDAAILNPPYGKIRRGSDVDNVLRAADVDCTNLYSAFLALVPRLLKPGGEVVAIVPRSFCNGPYFRAFRRDFLARMTFTHLHVFQERGSTFSDDAVLQENIIFRAVRTTERGTVMVSASAACDDTDMTVRLAPHDELVQPDDPESFVRIATDELDAAVVRRMASLTETLPGLGLSVSTGPLVDFRARDFLRMKPDHDTVPLLYPLNLRGGRVTWPGDTERKAQAIVSCEASRHALVPSGTYVLVKRFSAKEERRRVVACVLRPEDAPGDLLGLENHLNYFHRDGGSVNPTEAYGLAAFLGSSLVDQFFRQFNGHTQVNATDLRSMRYPSAQQLAALGRRARSALGDQEKVDAIVQEVLFPMTADDAPGDVDPVKAKQRKAKAGTLKKQYAKQRQLARIEVQVAPGKTIDLTPGGQNVLVEKIINDFLPRFTPGARVVHVGDTGDKLAYLDDGLLKSLGVQFDLHGQFPDVIVFYEAEGWLVLIEAVTAHGPVDEKRHKELRELFADCKAGIVYVTAFLGRGALAKYVREIAWETEVWTADAPDHLIHFDGERFLGPYES